MKSELDVEAGLAESFLLKIKEISQNEDNTKDIQKNLKFLSKKVFIFLHPTHPNITFF